MSLWSFTRPIGSVQALLHASALSPQSNKGMPKTIDVSNDETSLASSNSLTHPISARELAWALGGLAAVHRMPFDPALVLGQFAPPYSLATLVQAAQAMNFSVSCRDANAVDLRVLKLPCFVLLRAAEGDAPQAKQALQLASIGRAADGEINVLTAESEAPTALEIERFTGWILEFVPRPMPVKDDDAVAEPTAFGFGWFGRELIKHRTVWRDVLVASLVIQLIGLTTPLL